MNESELVEELRKGIEDALKPLRPVTIIRPWTEEEVDELFRNAARYALSVLGWKDAKKEPPKEEGIYQTAVLEPSGKRFVAEDKWDGRGWWQADDLKYTVTHYRPNIPLPEDK